MGLDRTNDYCFFKDKNQGLENIYKKQGLKIYKYNILNNDWEFTVKYLRELDKTEYEVDEDIIKDYIKYNIRYDLFSEVELNQGLKYLKDNNISLKIYYRDKNFQNLYRLNDKTLEVYDILENNWVKSNMDIDSLTLTGIKTRKEVIKEYARNRLNNISIYDDGDVLEKCWEILKEPLQ